GPECASITATITDIAYLGHHVSCVLETSGGEPLTISVRQPGSHLAVGARCELSWPYEATWLLPIRDAQ
ncbi:TOBE domain-containing protein, partial [Streptomyces brasiliscabiei]